MVVDADEVADAAVGAVSEAGVDPLRHNCTDLFRSYLQFADPFSVLYGVMPFLGQFLSYFRSSLSRLPPIFSRKLIRFTHRFCLHSVIYSARCAVP